MNDVERAVERLTENHVEETEAGPVSWPPLLTWLEKSVTEMVKRGGAGSGGAGIPIDFEALHLLDRIKRELRSLCDARFICPSHPTVVDTLKHYWGAAKVDFRCGYIAEAEWALVCEKITGWVIAIEAEQNVRPRKMELTVPCPRCETRWVQEVDDEGEPLADGEVKAAVVIEFGEGRAPVAECRMAACDALWAGWEAVATLGVTINANMDMEVLKACGIDLKIDTLN